MSLIEPFGLLFSEVSCSDGWIERLKMNDFYLSLEKRDKIMNIPVINFLNFLLYLFLKCVSNPSNSIYDQMAEKKAQFATT